MMELVDVLHVIYEVRIRSFKIQDGILILIQNVRSGRSGMIKRHFIDRTYPNPQNQQRK